MEILDRVNGTLIWYYCICPREAWLIARQITPDEDDPNIVIGRFLHDHRYAREKKEILLDGGKMDVVKWQDESVVVREVKKSSRYLESARMQLLYYLKLMREHGIEARGELVFPEEHKKEVVMLTEDNLRRLEQMEADILRLVNQVSPPSPVKISFCRSCAYHEYCWV
ncbi:MAG: CRISPR-associated protein Cas4 [Bacillota bacterium]